MTELVVDSRLINLNSKDAVKNNGAKLSDVLFKFRNIFREDQDVYYITCGVLNAQIPVSFYNVNVNNQTLVYTVNGTSYTLTIAEGNYNSTTFATAFISGFSSGGHGKTLTISLNKLNGRLVLTLTSTYTLVFKYASSTMFGVLGLDLTSDYTISTTTATTLTYPCNLLGVLKIKVISSALSNFSYDSSTLGSTDLIQTMTVNDAAFGLVTFQNQIEFYGRLKTRRLNEIDIQLRDENNALIDFNGVKWSITLHFNIYRKITFSDDTLRVNPLQIILDKLDDVDDNNDENSQPTDSLEQNQSIAAPDHPPNPKEIDDLDLLYDQHIL
jgi:hypothetical protein